LKLIVKPSSPLIKWPHRVMDNFFTEDELTWIERQFAYGLKEVKKKYWPLFDENGNMLPDNILSSKAREHRMLTPTTATNGFSCFVPFWSTERYIEVINDIWEEASEVYPWQRNNDIRRKDYFCFLELNMYPPGLNYNWHCDINYKSFTGVVYIGEHGDGTILKSGSNELGVNWKHNRGLFFMNCDKNRRNEFKNGDVLTSVHRYINTTNKVRYAVNFNLTHIDNIGQLIDKGVICDESLKTIHHVQAKPPSAGMDSKKRHLQKFKPIVLSIGRRTKKEK